jgi:hypothetical protein
MDYPSQEKSTWLDLRRIEPNGWSVDVFNRELRERVNRYNTAVNLSIGDLGPVLKLWIARLCYYPAERDNEKHQKDMLEEMLRTIYYKKNKLDAVIAALQDVGIKHLQANTYPTTKRPSSDKKKPTSTPKHSAVDAERAWKKVLKDRETWRLEAEAAKSGQE